MGPFCLLLLEPSSILYIPNLLTELPLLQSWIECIADMKLVNSKSWIECIYGLKCITSNLFNTFNPRCKVLLLMSQILNLFILCSFADMKLVNTNYSRSNSITGGVISGLWRRTV